MELEIVKKRENPLMGRVEVHFTVRHAGEATPNRDAVRDNLATQVGAKRETVILQSLKSTSGKAVTAGYARVYPSREAAASERRHILVRNKLAEKKAKKEEAPPAAKKGGKK